MTEGDAALLSNAAASELLVDLNALIVAAARFECLGAMFRLSATDSPFAALIEPDLIASQQIRYDDGLARVIEERSAPNFDPLLSAALESETVLPAPDEPTEVSELTIQARSSAAITTSTVRFSVSVIVPAECLAEL